MKYQLKDYLTDINFKKENIMDKDEEAINDYPPFIINKCLSGFIDTILHSNQMNLYNHLDKKLQYDFYLNSIRAKKRFSPWLKKEKLEDIELIKSYYNYSEEKAKIALKILNKDQIDYIRKKMITGGTDE